MNGGSTSDVHQPSRPRLSSGNRNMLKENKTQGVPGASFFIFAFFVLKLILVPACPWCLWEGSGDEVRTSAQRCTVALGMQYSSSHPLPNLPACCSGESGSNKALCCDAFALSAFARSSGERVQLSSQKSGNDSASLIQTGLCSSLICRLTDKHHFPFLKIQCQSSYNKNFSHHCELMNQYYKCTRDLRIHSLFQLQELPFLSVITDWLVIGWVNLFWAFFQMANTARKWLFSIGTVF